MIEPDEPGGYTLQVSFERTVRRRMIKRFGRASKERLR